MKMTKNYSQGVLQMSFPLQRSGFYHRDAKHSADAFRISPFRLTPKIV